MRRLLASSLLAAIAAAQDPTPTRIAALQPSFSFLQHPPVGLPAMPLPPGDPPSAAAFALGQRLFADPILSRDRTVTCQSCHPPATAFASPEARPHGVDGRLASRHAPALINRGYGTSMRWDGSVASLEDFVVQPIADSNEMDLPVDTALQRLRGDDDYRAAFAAAFPDGVQRQNLATALATFVRGIASGDAPYDRFVAGDHAAMTPEQRSGLWLFESKAGCWRCHPAPLFTDEAFHDTGIGVRDGVPEPGRANHTGDPADRGRFKTPTLRGVAHSAPFMHDGSIATLAEVVAFYRRGGNANPQLDPHLRPLPLDAREEQQLVAFLLSL